MTKLKPYSSITVLFMLMFFSGLYSCKDTCSCKKVPCPGYKNQMFDQWFPYKTSDQLIFKDSLGSIDTIMINNVQFTDAYEAKKGCIGADNGCSIRKDIFSKEVVNNNYSLKFSVEYGSNSDWGGTVVDSGYSMQLYDFKLNAYSLKDTGFLVWPGQSSKFYTTILFNGQTYKNVQAIWNNDTTSLKTGVYKIYIQKNSGLLAYEYYPSKIWWLRQ